MEAALDWGIRIVELDVRVTRCGTPVVFHDEDVCVGDTSIKISQTALSDFSDLGGRFLSIPTLEAVLARAAQHQDPPTLLVDIKESRIEEAVAGLVRAHGLRDQAVYVSWLPEVLYAVHRLDSSVPLCFSHWPAEPGALARRHHTVHESFGEVPEPPPSPRGTRSGWLLHNYLEGELMDILSKVNGYVCIPVGGASLALLSHYSQRGVRVCPFSYTRPEAALEAAAAGYGPLFVDDRAVFEAVTRDTGRA